MSAGNRISRKTKGGRQKEQEGPGRTSCLHNVIRDKLRRNNILKVLRQIWKHDKTQQNKTKPTILQLTTPQCYLTTAVNRQLSDKCSEVKSTTERKVSQSGCTQVKVNKNTQLPPASGFKNLVIEQPLKTLNGASIFSILDVMKVYL